MTLAIVTVQAVVLGLLAATSGSATLYAEAAFSVADVGVESFLLIGLSRSTRPADPAHPLGYGREAFFWALFAAVGLFLGGGVASVFQGVRELGAPEAAGSYLFGCLVIAAITITDGWALAVSWQALRAHAAASGRPPWLEVVRTTDPAAATVLLANLVAVVSGPFALAGLALHQATGRGAYDAAGSIVIGVLLTAASLLLLRLNAGLITSPSVGARERDAIRARLEAMAGIDQVRELTAVVTGPRQTLVVARVTLDPDLDRAGVTRAITSAEHALAESAGIRAVFVAPCLTVLNRA